MSNTYYGYTSPVGLAHFVNRYDFVCNFVKDKVILDVACATGWGANYLYNKGARMTVGGDISEGLIQYAHSRYHAKERLYLLLLNAESLPFADNTFDVIV